MAERKAVNKYYPPDWDPRKGSVNKRVGQHPLRDRAKKLSQGILVIRFELPYNIWCGGCGSHVGMGVRYNAEKSKVGNYYTTPIYKFRMKCHLCDNYFEIQTDPKNHDYVILSGARRKEQRWDPVANEQIVPEDKATQKKMAMDAMYKLEHGSDDKVKGKEKVKSLAELESSRLSMKEDYLLNRLARDKFRAEKKVLKEASDADRSILERGALDIELLEETESDRNLAGLLKYTVTSSFEEKQEEKRKSIEQRPLFNSNKTSISSASSASPSSSSAMSVGSCENSDDTKHKLSETLRLAMKDPFAIAKPLKLFGMPTSRPSALGIRLKHSKVTKKSKNKSNIHKKAVISHLRNCSSNKNTNDQQLDGKSKLGAGLIKVDDFDNVNNPVIMPQAKVGTSNPLSGTASAESSANDNYVLCSSKALKTQGTSQAAQASPISPIGQEHTHRALPTSNPSTPSLSNSLNASGLSMLMSSYDEDKDSDSSGSGS